MNTKMLRTLFSSRPPKQEAPKAEKPSLGARLAEWVTGLLLDALKRRWENSLWEPKK